MKATLRKAYHFVRQGLYREKKYPVRNTHPVGEIFVFIRSWNRPLYLWACLDNFYHNTRSSCKFILIDNASSDPMVKQVIRGFEKRGMFHAVHFMEENHGANQEKILQLYRKEMGKYFFLVDADILIEKMQGCWLAAMIDIAERNERLSLLGSYIDTSDFISIEKAKEAAPQLTEEELIPVIKLKSIERRTPPKVAEVINPFLPAGRLLLVKTTAIDKTGLPIGNKNLCRVLREAGYEYGTATAVVHRHLSLLNLYDYPDYDFDQLNKYLSGK